MASKRQERLFNVAEAVAQLSDFPRIQIGAVIARKNHILSVGVNREKSHPLQKKFNAQRFVDNFDTCQHHLHAEMDALLKVKRGEDLSKVSVYVFRKNQNGQLAPSRPCPACLTYIKSVGIKDIFYTTYDGFASEQLAA
jgi:deoxycytidylate deaminase